MLKSLRKSVSYLKIVNGAIVDMPAPVNISLWWNLGSLLGLCLVIQLLSGLFLSMFYISDLDSAFSSVVHISRDVNFGWLLRSLHANGASFFFVCVYLHMARGLYYFSFNLQETWNIGVIMYVVLMATAFMGYVLPWGQMSFWGATVITSLLSAIPYFGVELVNWVWGGFAVDSATLTRFFALHFLLPFVLSALSVLHIMFLHQTGSNNPLGGVANMMKVPMHPYFTTKDLLGFSVMTFFFSVFVFFNPELLGDPENFIPADPLSTPLHIKPEWYFLWLYAILRSIPNKLGGVVAMFAAILIMLLLSFTRGEELSGMGFSVWYSGQVFFWYMVMTIFILTWIGGCPVEYPYDKIGLVFTIFYFLLMSGMISFLLNKFE